MIIEKRHYIFDLLSLRRVEQNLKNMLQPPYRA